MLVQHKLLGPHAVAAEYTEIYVLASGQRLVETPGALHFYDGRRVVTLTGDDEVRAAIVRLLAEPCGAADLELTPRPGLTDQTTSDLVALLSQLRLVSTRAPDGTGRSPDDPGEADRVSVDVPSPVRVAAAFASAGTAGWVHESRATERLQATEIHVVGGTADGLSRTLEASGLRLGAPMRAEQIHRLDPERAVLAVIAADERPTGLLAEVNRACVSTGLSWLPIGAYDGSVLRVGPLIVPGQTACFECTLQRLAANVEFPELYRQVMADVPAPATPAALREWSYSIAALLFLQWIAARNPDIPGQLYTLAPDDVGIRRATVFRVPRCPACAAPDYLPAAAPWETARAR